MASRYHKPDYAYIGTFALILFIGLFMLSSVSTAVAFHRFADSYYYIKHQLLFGVIPGILALLVVANIDYKYWRQWSWPLIVASIVLLVLVFIPGIGYKFGGARSWINFFGIIFQPSEILKLTFLIYLATWLEKRGLKKVKDFHDGFLPFLSSLGIIMLLIILQPDIGTMSIIVMISLIVFFVGGGAIKHLLALSAGGIGLLALLIKIAPYRAARFKVFLDPASDPQGIGYHINQALIAIGSGGLFGVGFGHSRQKHLYLPEVIGDSVFAVMAEELGFVVITAFILLFVFLTYRGFLIAKHAPDRFSQLVATGITAWISVQAIINIAAMVSLMPLTGLTLPFISYGSSSLVILMVGVGIMINISRQTVDRPRKFS